MTKRRFFLKGSGSTDEEDNFSDSALVRQRKKRLISDSAHAQQMRNRRSFSQGSGLPMKKRRSFRPVLRLTERKSFTEGFWLKRRSFTH
jgi:hypothetical protein